MKEYAAKRVDELIGLIESFDENVLFRGQTSHYGEIGAGTSNSRFKLLGMSGRSTVAFL